MTPVKSHLLARCHCCGVARHVEFLDGNTVTTPVGLTGLRVRRRLPERCGTVVLRVELNRRWLLFEGSVSDAGLETVGCGSTHRFPQPVVLERGDELRVAVEDPYAAAVEVEFIGEVLP